MIGFKLTKSSDDSLQEILSLKKKIINVLWNLGESLGDIAEDTAQKTIFYSSQKGFTRRSGDFAAQGLNKVQRSIKARGATISVYLSSRVGNMYENYKNRKQVKLYGPLKKYFEREGRIETVLSKAYEELRKE